MSPEYALNGVFSVKSDVFSFGVLVLETISGKRNKGVYLSEAEEFLLGKVSKNMVTTAICLLSTCILCLGFNYFRHGLCGKKVMACNYLMHHWIVRFPWAKF